MTSTYKGSCLCKQVTFEANGFSAEAAACHCTMCRKFHGAPFAVLVAVEHFKVLTGADQLKQFKGDNGTVRTFCSCCGSSIGFVANGTDEFEVAIACFDDDIPVAIDAHVFTNHKANWFEPDKNLLSFGEGREKG